MHTNGRAKPSDRGDATWRILAGDARERLREVPPGSCRMCVTSPPYWSLRDYDVPGQIGLEPTLDRYLESLIEVFEGVGRALTDDGTLWLNLGDSYTSGGRTWRAPDRKNPVRAMDVRPPTPDGLKPKDLIGIPWRLAFALQKAGWYLRADLVWSKPNGQPESVKDRPTRTHEYVFLLSKRERYHYDADAVRGPNGRNLRSVWEIPTEPRRDAHGAQFPRALVDPCIRICSEPGDLVLDPFVGSGTTALSALALGRRFIGVELNSDYVAVAERRIRALHAPV